MYKDWEGSVMLKVVYPAGTNLEAKKELIFKRYQRVPSMEEDRVLRFKVMRMYINELDKAMMNYYGDTLAAAGEEIAKYTDQMEH